MVTGDAALADAFRDGDWRAAGVSPREHVLLEHAERLTQSPSSVSVADLDALRAVGMDDTGIFQLTAFASMFAYLNRMADGLGVGR
jgi:uncharacterized peroxidase-related enzyme